MLAEPVIGWDVGGAHLKGARLDASGTVERVVQLPCPLWQGLEHLEGALHEAGSALGSAARDAVTMTGEMVDLFDSREEGVARLVAAMGDCLPGRDLRFFAGRDGFLSSHAASAAAEQVASANWMASGVMVAGLLRDAILVDIGSTTTDLIAIRRGTVAARGYDDAARLVTGELVYTGVVRTPVMALAPRVPFAGEWVPQMAEHFAASADVYRLIGRLPEGADQYPTADGGEKTERGSARRLARMIGRDAAAAPGEVWRGLAEWLAAEQLRGIREACERVIARENLPGLAPLVGAGVGRFLATDIALRLGRPYIELAGLLTVRDGEAGRASDCGPAVAVAWLARRESA